MVTRSGDSGIGEDRPFDRLDFQSGAWMADTEEQRDAIRRSYLAYKREGYGYEPPRNARLPRHNADDVLRAAIKQSRGPVADEFDLSARLTKMRDAAQDPFSALPAPEEPTERPVAAKVARKDPERQPRTEGRANAFSEKLGIPRHKRTRRSQSPIGHHERYVKAKAEQKSLSIPEMESRIKSHPPECHYQPNPPVNEAAF